MIKLTPSDLPNKSHGPYSITVFALTSVFECLHVAIAPEIELQRCNPSTNLSIDLPDLQ